MITNKKLQEFTDNTFSKKVLVFGYSLESFIGNTFVRINYYEDNHNNTGNSDSNCFFIHLDKLLNSIKKKKY